MIKEIPETSYPHFINNLKPNISDFLKSADFDGIMLGYFIEKEMDLLKRNE
ncbi:hypothetical protein [Virgibacillus indicus]|uniref:hypothetical protein n=1 Tax=Virgibacillus indicus TaxID=2024554 RepID=UPI0013FDB2B9|nr:hypothetical protein [Virgibacillus indicus]